MTEEAYINILQFLPIPDIPQFALASRKLSQFVRDDRVWKVKLGWLDYKGPGEIDWRGKEKGKGKESGQSHLQPSTISPVPAPRPLNRTSSPALSSDDEFGDFFDGGVDEEGNQGGSEKAGTDDGFGDFQDGDFTEEGDTSTDPFGLSVGFTDTVKLDSKPKPPKAADDLLLMFDDDDEDDLIANPPPAPNTVNNKPRRPPAVTNLTFDTQPTFPSPPLATARPSAFAFNPSTPSPTTPTAPSPNYRQTYQTYHSLLLPYYSSLITHTTSSLVFTTPSLSPMTRAQLLSSLSRFCHPLLAPTRSLPQRLTVLRNVQSAMDFFESALLSEFEKADTLKDEKTMKDKAKVLWELNTTNSLSQIFVQKREVFYDQSFNPLRNLT